MEKILAFHFNDTELFQLRQLAATLKFHLVPVADTDYMQPLSALASGKKILWQLPTQERYQRKISYCYAILPKNGWTSSCSPYKKATYRSIIKPFSHRPTNSGMSSDCS